MSCTHFKCTLSCIYREVKETITNFCWDTKGRHLHMQDNGIPKPITACKYQELPEDKIKKKEERNETD